MPDEYRAKYDSRECESTKDGSKQPVPAMRYYLVQHGDKFRLLELDSFGEGMQFADYGTSEASYTFVSYPNKNDKGDAYQFEIPRDRKADATRLAFKAGTYEVKKPKRGPASIEGTPLLRCPLVNRAHAGEAAAAQEPAPPPDSKARPLCVPGQTQECVGPGACKGGQVCLPDGSGYGVCDCGTTESPAKQP